MASLASSSIGEKTDLQFTSLRSQILQHGWGSGEIIVEIQDTEILQNDFESSWHKALVDWGVQTKDFKLVAVSREQAWKKIQIGLSVKANYTIVQREFTEAEILDYFERFCSFFYQPSYYSNQDRSNHRIWQDSLNEDTFWVSSGFIVFDKRRIGIFWVNDLY